MSFIRTKEVPPGSGNFYDYLVKTVHVQGKVRQKHLGYLGKKGTYLPPVKERKENCLESN